MTMCYRPGSPAAGLLLGQRRNMAGMSTYLMAYSHDRGVLSERTGPSDAAELSCAAANAFGQVSAGITGPQGSAGRRLRKQWSP